MSKVQIVIPAINLWSKYTKPCIESVKTRHDYRILLVDNASTDETKEEAGKMVSDRFAHKRNEERWSCSKSWNYGIRDAFERGFDYVLVLNNDVVLHPDAIDRLVDRFEQAKENKSLVRPESPLFSSGSPASPAVEAASVSQPDIAIRTIRESEVLAMVTMLDVRGESVEGNVERPDKMLSLDKSDVPEAEHPCFSGFMINRACWDRVGEFDEGFDPAYFEDNDYHHRINLAGMKAIVYPPAMFYHFGSKTQTEGLPPDPGRHRRFEANRAYFVEKWGGQPGMETYKRPFDNPANGIGWTKQNNNA